MMRTLSIAVMVAVALIAAACSGSPGTAATAGVTTVAPTTTATESTSTTAASEVGYDWSFGQIVDFDGMLVTVDAFAVDHEPTFVDKGEKCWVALVTITSERSEPISYTEMDFNFMDAEGFTYNCMGGTSKPTLGTGTLMPGQTVKGYLSANMPASAVPAQVQLDSWLPTEEDNWLALWR